jgi:hypothetical protein
LKGGNHKFLPGKLVKRLGPVFCGGYFISHIRSIA